MKRCPECLRDYYDETLLYCLDDGTRLLDGPSTGDQPTAIFNAEIAEFAENQKTRVFSLRAPRSLRSYQPTEVGNQNAPTNSIAVLPFANISTDEENEYFCDGLAE